MHIRTNKRLNVVLKPLVVISEWVGAHYPVFFMKTRYYLRFHKKLDLKHPQTLNEKILYLSLKTDTTEWTRCADKYAVRGYVEECDLGYTLTKLYAYWLKEEEVDFNALPDSFVIKSVQGCGDVIIVRDKTNFDQAAAYKLIHTMLHNRYGALEGGIHYMRINPAVITEELLPVDEGKSLIDYKIWCFNGKPSSILTCSDRTKGGVKLGSYDKEWNYHPEHLISSQEHPLRSTPLPKPENFDEMLKIAEKLSKPFPQVRVDLYNINGNIYFGEMTFTAYGGMMNYYTEEFQHMAGKLIDINYKN